jgi:hypothetical protein
MSDEVVVSIPVSPEAAEMLRDRERARAVGKLVSDILRPANPGMDPLAALIAEVKADARAGGLTDEEIDAELSAYNAERRL